MLGLKIRQALAVMQYDLAATQALMQREGLVTILLAYAEPAWRFHTRNPSPARACSLAAPTRS